LKSPFDFAHHCSSDDNPRVAEDPRPLAPVDEVREELRRLGYLDSGLDRFVLGAARRGSALQASFRAALRVGLAGGAVFGVALSLLALSLEPEALRRPADLALLALYLAVATGIAAAAASFVVGLAAASFAPVAGRQLPRAAAVLLAGAGLLYLWLWWRSHGSEAPPAQQAAFVAIGAAVALLLGRFGAVAAVAALSSGGRFERMPEAALARRRVLPLLLGAALVLGSSLALANYLETRAERAPDFAVVPSGVLLRVVAIDGLELRMTEQMLARGEMPRLAALLAQGASAPLEPETEQVPAIVWTTIATGRGPEAHGIRSAGARRLPGMAAPVPLAERSGVLGALARAADTARLTRAQPPTALLRGAKTFWNVAAEKGLRIGVVNFWASWPAEPVNGFLVSDRAYLKLEKGGDPDRECWPEDALERLRPLLESQARSRPHRLDRFHAAALQLLARAAPPDLEAVYLNGLDVFTMQALGGSAADVASLDERLEEVRGYHRFLDDRIAELAADLSPRRMLVIVADPGRFARRSGTGTAGLLLLAGGPARATRLARASERDVAPTLLHLLGLPVSRELPGRVLQEALLPAFLASHPPRSVASYGRRPRARAAASSFDRDVIQELRSLGYIQ
jgi:hypothetical protein